MAEGKSRFRCFHMFIELLLNTIDGTLVRKKIIKGDEIFHMISDVLVYQRYVIGDKI